MFQAPEHEIINQNGGFQAPQHELLDQPQQPQETSWSDVPGNAVEGVKNLLKGGIESTKNIIDPFRLGQSAYEGSFEPAKQNISNQWEALKNTPKAIVKPYVDIAKDVGSVFTDKPHPFETFKRDPVGTSLALAPAAPKAAKLLGKVPVIGDMAEGASSLAKGIGKKAFSTAFNVPEESVSARYSNPSAIKNAATSESLALNDVPAVANKFDQIINGLHSEAKKTLSKSPYLEDGAFTKDEVLGTVKTARTKLGGVYTAEGKSAAKTLGNLQSDLNKIRNTVSQNQVHDLIVNLDNEIPWQKVWKAPETLTLEDNAMIDARTKLDGLLKQRNTPYTKVMEPMAEVINNRNEYLKNFSLDKTRGGGYTPSNTTASRVGSAMNENKLASQRILGKTKELTGEDLGTKVKNARIAEDFQPDRSKGETFYSSARNVLSSPPMAGKIIDYAAENAPKVSESVNSLRNAAPAMNAYKSAEEVRNAYRQGKISRDQAKSILQTQFGLQ